MKGKAHTHIHIHTHTDKHTQRNTKTQKRELSRAEKLLDTQVVSN